MSDIITDKRKIGFFMVDNEVLDNYNLSPYDFMVYCFFLKYAGKRDFCFPSLNTLAEKIKISKPQIIKSIKNLEQKKLISIQKIKHKEKGYVNNTYIINNVDKNYEEVVNHIDKGSKPYEQGVVNSVYPNNTHINNTHINNINTIAEKKFSEKSGSDNDDEIATSNESACDPSDIRPSDTLDIFSKNQENEKDNITDLNSTPHNKQIEAHKTSVNSQVNKNINSDKNNALFNDVNLSDPFGKPTPSKPVKKTKVKADCKMYFLPKPDMPNFYLDYYGLTWNEVVTQFCDAYKYHTKETLNLKLLTEKEFKHLKYLAKYYDNWRKSEKFTNLYFELWDGWIEDVILNFTEHKMNKGKNMPYPSDIYRNINYYLPKKELLND